jgi:hypothetical protein
LIQNDPPVGERNCNGAAADDVRCNGVHLKGLLGDEALPMSGAMKIANDFVAPIVGLFSSRTGRGAYAARALEVAFYHGGARQPQNKGRRRGLAVLPPQPEEQRGSEPGHELVFVSPFAERYGCRSRLGRRFAEGGTLR